MRRLPELAVSDRAALQEILDAGLVAHVGVAGGDGSSGTGTAELQPYVLPCAYARDGDRLLLHGSTGSRLFRSLADGAAACVTVTHLDGLVYARSVFNCSMNYRSAMVLGRGAAVPESEKEAALRVLAEHLLPGRWGEARPPSRRELAATLIVTIPLEETSVKISAGPPDDDAADLDRPVWAGVLPLRIVAAGKAESATEAFTVPDYVVAHPLGRVSPSE